MISLTLEQPCLLWPFPLQVIPREKEDLLAQDTLMNLKAAYAEWLTGVYSHIVVPGGVWMKGQQVPASDLIINWFWEKMGHEFRKDLFISEKTSVTTRSNILCAAAALEERGLHIQNCRHTVVSERWHALGIQMMFFRAYGIWPKAIQSGYRLDFKSTVGRIGRLGLYVIDPYEQLSISKRELEKRRRRL